jgi:hypothetical protein
MNPVIFIPYKFIYDYYVVPTGLFGILFNS